MSYGVAAYNLNGDVLFDATLSNLHEWASGTATVLNEVVIPMPSATAIPVILVKPKNGLSVAYKPTLSATELKLEFFVYPHSTTEAVDYKVYLAASEVSESSDAYGLRVYNENGELTYDSGYKTPNVIGEMYQEVVDYNVVTDTTLPYASDIWVEGFPLWTGITPNWTQGAIHCAVKTDGTTISIDRAILYGGVPPMEFGAQRADFEITFRAVKVV